MTCSTAAPTVVFGTAVGTLGLLVMKQKCYLDTFYAEASKLISEDTLTKTMEQFGVTREKAIAHHASTMTWPPEVIKSVNYSCHDYYSYYLNLSLLFATVAGAAYAVGTLHQSRKVKQLKEMPIA